MEKSRHVPAEEILRQWDFIRLMREENDARIASGRLPLVACTRTFGCQQNENDTERINGMLEQMGFDFTDSPESADLVLFNTCAIRDHAEQKVYGTVGALAPLKKAAPDKIIALCGCMVQQRSVARTIRSKYRHVDLLFGPHALHRFPENLYRVYTKRGCVIDNEPSDGMIAEDLPIRREDKTRAWVTIMSGCNNFCTYCIVPHVRGRERSRDPKAVLREVKELIEAGYRDITLLGQNVNSYCNDLEIDYDFSDLLREIDALDGDFTVRFMTSHPKDASEKLIDTIAAGRHLSHHIHLPVQSGSDRILNLMNRRYTREDYLKLIRYAKERISDVVFTSDIIVGFPTETEEDFEDTLALVREVEYDGLYTFIYSPRKGTPAAEMEQIPDEVKGNRYRRLCDLQSELSLQANQRLVGTVQTVLVTGINEKDPSLCDGRTDGNKLVHFPGNYPAGTTLSVRIDRAFNWGMLGSVSEA